MKKIFIVLSIFSIIKINAQDKDFRGWGTINFNNNINKNWFFASDYQYRSYNKLNNLNQLLLRGGLGYNLNTNNNLLVGYAFVLTRNFSETEKKYSTIIENRIYQQYNNKLNLGKINFNNRLRFEERLMNNDIFYRFRYQISATYPINNKKIDSKTFYTKLSNELFLNTIKQNNFDRNRLSISLGYTFNENFALETGYMKQHVQHNQTNHLLIGVNISNIL